MPRYIVSTRADCNRMRVGVLERRRQAVGAQTDTSPDGKPYTTRFSGPIIEGRTGTGDEQGTPTGSYLWIPERDRDVQPEDEGKEVQERDLGDEFRFRPNTPSPQSAARSRQE